MNNGQEFYSYKQMQNQRQCAVYREGIREAWLHLPGSTNMPCSVMKAAGWQFQLLMTFVNYSGAFLELNSKSHYTAKRRFINLFLVLSLTQLCLALEKVSLSV